MAHRLKFDPPVLRAVVGGKSAIDMPNLNIHSLEEADSFLLGYGFDSKNSEDIEKIWYYHRRALVLMQEKLKIDLVEMPELLKDRKLLEDPRKILLFASSENIKDRALQKWSCSLLRCIHVFVHAENDLFSSFAEEIQKQILGPFQACVFHDGTSGQTLLKRPEGSMDSLQLYEKEPLVLLGFDAKPFKTSTSTVIKLLAKSDALAMSVFDKVGVRFVTNSMFDTFRVVRFLIDEDLVSYPHIIPNQSTNTLYPVELFLKACSDLVPTVRGMDSHQIDKYFADYLEAHRNEVEFLKKENVYSGADYRFIKFIARKLIRIEIPGAKEKFSFFYPFEVQIVDQESRQKAFEGPSEHQAYKDRQIMAARKRLFPETL